VAQQAGARASSTANAEHPARFAKRESTLDEFAVLVGEEARVGRPAVSNPLSGTLKKSSEMCCI
jgi:hypothetical protein